MAIDDELKAQILRYHFVEHWRVGTIASQLAGGSSRGAPGARSYTAPGVAGG